MSRSSVPARRSALKAGLAGALSLPALASAQTNFNWKMTSAYGKGTPFYMDGPGSATDLATNTTARVVRFVVDRTPPTVGVSGVGDGEFVSHDVAPAVVVTDLHLDSFSVTLDGLPFTAGTLASAEGLHVLVVEAVDRAQNRARVTVSFTIDRTPPVVALGGFADGSHVNTD